MMSGQRQDFIDWLKASGMLLILIGHLVGAPDALFNAVSVPVYSKQLGVAFFVFAAGWSLANDQRPALRAAFNRAFPIYLYGLLCALALSAIYWFSKGTINKSNYLPLMGGINVFFNFFPANPTTWYIGMYLHLLLFWLWQGRYKIKARAPADGVTCGTGRARGFTRYGPRLYRLHADHQLDKPVSSRAVPVAMA